MLTRSNESHRDRHNTHGQGFKHDIQSHTPRRRTRATNTRTRLSNEHEPNWIPLHQSIDKGTGRNSISYRCSSNTVAFNVGLDLRVKGKRVLGQRDLMHFVKTYCNAMSYSWVLEGKVHAPDATKRANAKSWLLSIQQTHDTYKRCGWLCQLVRGQWQSKFEFVRRILFKH